MEHKRRYTYTERDKERIRKVNCRHLRRTYLSHALLDCCAPLICRPLNRKEYLALYDLTNEKEVLLDSSKIREIQFILHKHLSDRNRLDLVDRDMSSVLSIDGRGILYIFRVGDDYIIADTYRMMPSNGHFDVFEEGIRITCVGNRIVPIDDRHWVEIRGTVDARNPSEIA